MELDDYLRNCRELNLLCSQNGWIDSDTIRVEVVEQGPDSVLTNVRFEEILMEGSGCETGRVTCYGRVRAYLSPDRQVERLEVL